MKKTAFILLLLLSKMSIAQVGEGIGPFKLGSSFKFMVDTIAFDTIRIYEDPSIKYRESGTAYILDPYGKYYSIYERSSKWKCLFIDEYQVGGISVRDIYLTFFNDTLIEYSSKCSKELEEALSIKYGESKDTISSKIVNCVGTYTGAKLERKEILVSKRWQKDGFKCNSFTSLYYNSSCEQNVVSGFYYKIDAASIAMKKEARLEDIDGKRKAEELNKKKESLKGF